MHSPALLFLCALGLSSVVFAGDDVAEEDEAEQADVENEDEEPQITIHHGP